MTTIIGIDPGLTGAVAILHHGDPVVWDMPVLPSGAKGTRNLVDALTLAMELEHLEGAHAFVELQGARPGQGVCSMLSLGTSYGIVLGVLGALRIPYETVSAVEWKRRYVDRKAPKEASVAMARQLFPGLAGELTRKKDHGRAEALLIADWGRRQLGRAAHA